MYRPDRQRMIFKNYAAIVRIPNGGTYSETANAPSRKQAFAMIARQFPADHKVEWFRCADEMSIDDQERWGFIAERVRPTRIDFSKLDLF